MMIWLLFCVFTTLIVSFVVHIKFNVDILATYIIGCVFFITLLNSTNWWRFYFMPLAIHESLHELDDGKGFDDLN